MLLYFIWLHFYYPTEAVCFLTNDIKTLDPNWRVYGEEVGTEDGGEPIISIHYVRKKIYFQKKEGDLLKKKKIPSLLTPVCQNYHYFSPVLMQQNNYLAEAHNKYSLDTNLSSLVL